MMVTLHGSFSFTLGTVQEIPGAIIFEYLKKVCIIYRTVKFTTSSHAVTALSVSTVGTVWWQGHYTFTFLLRNIWQLPTYILMFSTSVSVISKQPKHTSCT